MSERYRVEPMGGTPEELKQGMPPETWTEGGWCIVRNHDDELMSIYDTREQAEAALREANDNAHSCRVSEAKEA